MTKKKALITGITGQDGSYLSQLLLEKGYEVWGLVRRSSTDPLERLWEAKDNSGNPIKSRLNLRYGNLSDVHSVEAIIAESKPDEIYNLAAQSDVGISFQVPYETKEVNYHGLRNLVHIVRNLRLDPRIYQASTSEMFGNTGVEMINEATPFNPQSPYAESKVEAHNDCVVRYRKEGMFICSGFLFNHESPRRGKHFVTKKITCAMSKIKLGLQDSFSLGNLNAKRDWGYAADYVKAMWMMLQQDKPQDYVIATGKSYSVRDFINKTAEILKIHIEWAGKGVNEAGYSDGKPIVTVDPKFYRPREVHKLCGDSSKARRELGWEPELEFDELVKIMADFDLQDIKRSQMDTLY